MLFEHDHESADKYPYMHQYTNYMKKMTRPLIGREHEKEQVMAAMLKPEYCNVLLLGEAGSGKCCKNGTMVPVFDERGYVQIEQLVPGDFVFDEKGNPTEVLGVFPQGMKHAYEVMFYDGTSVICNDEHIWGARTRKQHYTDKPYRDVTLREMMDYGIWHVRQSGKRPGMTLNNWYVPVAKAVHRGAVDLPVDPYVVGVLIGDGSLAANNALTISSDDEFVVRKVASLIGAADIIKRPNNYDWQFVHADGNSPKYIRQDDILADKMFQCVAHTKSVNRRIPRTYMLGSIDQRRMLLQGLMDTDGCVTGRGRVNCAFATNNEGLMHDVQELAASLGIRSSVTVVNRDDEIHKNAEYTVHFKLPDDEKENLFTLPRQIEKIRANRRHDKRFTKHCDDMAIVDVNDLGYDCEMTCIYVAAESHLFQVGREHIVTHNTALVQGIMVMDEKRLYLEVDLSKMIANLKNENEMADRLKTLFDEVMHYVKAKEREIVLFIDEFHQIVQLSPAAVEVLKPLLADSGTRGIRVIAATTHVEYQQFIAPNLPLVERLQRIKLVQPGRDVVVSILETMCRTYHVTPATPELFGEIYEYTNRYIPANSQPRKSILILDSMIGWHRLTKRPLDRKLLADVIYETEGINVAFRVDAASIKRRLDEKVIAQQVATSSIEQRMQIAVAGLNNPNRPMSSFLFAGSTGVGKANTCSTKIPVWTVDGSVEHKLAGDIVPGDYIFDRYGRPTRVLGVFPQGKRTVYRVTLSDGRHLDVSDNHLWPVWTGRNDLDSEPTILSTKYMVEHGVRRSRGTGKTGAKYFIPTNGGVARPDFPFSRDVYDMGCEAAVSGTVPMEICRGSLRQRQDFVDSLFDNMPDKNLFYHDDDNGATFYNVGLKSVDPAFASDLAYVIRSMGIQVSTHAAGDLVDLCVHSSRNDAVRPDPKNTHVGILSIEKLGREEEMVCFYVDNDEHLYQAGDFVVTHNTEATKQLAQILYDDDRNLIRFDMTEFALDNSLDRFRRELTNRVSTIPYCLILLDEIEKACAPVTRVLLQVLDDGRLLDENEREVTFKNAYIIVTTNSGSEIFKTISNYEQSDKADFKTLEKYDKLLRESIRSQSGSKFPPELLGRIDCIVPFQPLSRQTMATIIQMKLKALEKLVKQKHGVSLHVHENIYIYMLYDRLDTDSDSGGARIVVSKLEREVTVPLARYINEHPMEKDVYVSIGGRMAITDKRMLETEAYVYVGPKFLNADNQMGKLPDGGKK